MTEKYNLTPVELELMEIIWKLGQGTVRDVMNCLPKNRNLAYTSVSTILRILQQKGVLTANKLGRQHIYIPVFDKEKFATHSIKKMVKQVFSGNPVQLVAYLMSRKEISIDEVSEIQKLLDAKKRELSS